MLEQLTLESFQPYLQQTFQVQFDPPPCMDLTLAECELVSVPSSNAKRKPFRLVFVGGRTPVLPQRIYRIAHDRVGTLDIFLVPIGPDERGMQYEAIFT
jgi:hypothetical protein